MEKQFLVSISSERGAPRFQLVEVLSNYDLYNDPNFKQVAGGGSLNQQLTDAAGGTVNLQVAEG